LRDDRPIGAAGRITGTVCAAVTALLAVEIGRRVPALTGPAWVRRNYRGQAVNLVGGPAAAGTASVAAAFLPAGSGRSAALLGLAAGAVGLYDDIVGARPEQVRGKGVTGHLRALRAGRVSTGAVKVLGIVGASLVAAGPVSTGPLDRVVAAGVMAGTANLINLFDLRPGRAAKASALGATVLLGGGTGGVGAAVLGTSLGILPADLGEKVMLGDAGANALGALLGYRLAAGSSRPARAGILAGLVALTAASEKVSFTRVIEATPGLREFDRWGRLPVEREGASTGRGRQPAPPLSSPPMS